MFVCSNCDAQYEKWSGRCLECGQWGTIFDNPNLDLVKKNSKSKKSSSGKSLNPFEASKTVTLEELHQIGQAKPFSRLSTGWPEFDAVIGGGLVPGSVTLLAGEPGVGKSTLALQLAKNFSGLVLYLSGEENTNQLADRAVRLGLDFKSSLRLASVQNVDSIPETVAALEPALVIIDSIQTLTSNQVEGVAGSVSQVKAVAASLVTLAKEQSLPIVIIGHVTKDGNIAGPKTLEHIVDTVCYFEADQSDQYRLLKTQKNRFGSTDGLAVWELTATGLKSVAQMESIFLPPVPDKSSRVIGVMIEGQRPFLLEIQALITKTSFPYPERNVTGYDATRLKMLIAILQRYTDLSFRDDDVFVNVVGGWKIDDPALDAAVLAALILAKRPSGNKSEGTVLAIGEAGLDGSLRSPKALAARLQAAGTVQSAKIMAAGQFDKTKYPQVSLAETVKALMKVLD